MEISEKVPNAAQSNYIMRCRLAEVSDLVAADARYHLKCYVQFLRKHASDSTWSKERPQQMCIERVAEELSFGLKNGAVYTLLDVWGRYTQLLFEFQLDAGSYEASKTWFKNKLQGL